MSLTSAAVENRAVTYLIGALFLVGGFFSFFQLGQLEDPEFTVKTAVVVTAYPGASPAEVELEVTDRIELAVQELPQIKNIASTSSAGLSVVKIDIREEYWSDRLPQVWDELRRKINDVQPQLPPGAGRPEVTDDFGDVFGFVLAVTADTGFSYRELEGHVDALKKELSLVDGVARVDLWGVQQQVIYLDASETQTSALGITPAAVGLTLASQNVVVDAGNVNVEDRRFRFDPTGTFGSTEEIADLWIRASIYDELSSQGIADVVRQEKSTELIRIGDIGEVSRGYQDPPRWLMRHNDKPAIGIALTNVAGGNIVTIGRNIDAALEKLIPRLPVGIEVERVAWQSDEVTAAINNFMLSFAQAVAIVLVVLAVAMGWRMAVIIGTALVLTILGTFIFMAIFDIDLQRMSLGALIIALGMMVDNAIVVADGFAVRLQQGMDRKQAAIESGAQPSWPLLGATFIAVLAFYPIFASTANAGEFCRTLVYRGGYIADRQLGDCRDPDPHPMHAHAACAGRQPGICRPLCRQNLWLLPQCSRQVNKQSLSDHGRSVGHPGPCLCICSSLFPSFSFRPHPAPS